MITQDNQPIGLIKDNDSIIFFNFRADRAREITSAFTQPFPINDTYSKSTASDKFSATSIRNEAERAGLTETDFKEFHRKIFPKVLFTTLTQYDEKFTLPVAFKPITMKNILSEILSKNNIKQLRIAETEKYAHVTYFFNGGQEKPFPLEDRKLIPSPKVATYDMQPEMSAPEVTRQVLKDLTEGGHQIIIMNYANCDMVGHTGILKAAIKAVETVDDNVGLITEAILKKNGVVLITADHGNAEEMIDHRNGNQPHTYHTTDPVPFILVGAQFKDAELKKNGKLCDIAPTMLEIIGIEKPAEMDGISLLS